MRIGIDVSQVAYENTGVSNYLQNLVRCLIKEDSKNEYVLFFSSMRKDLRSSFLGVRGPSKNQELPTNIQIKKFKFPPTVLDLLWNRLHILPIETLIGDVDVFITSDWTEPPARKAKKATILYDLVVYKYPQETHKKIVETQKRKLKWVKKESEKILCISEATKHDAEEILGIPKSKLEVVYPGTD